jgi:hypothetical protein
MKKNMFIKIVSIAVGLLLLACSGATSVLPTVTPNPPTNSPTHANTKTKAPTKTPKPTSTPRPSETPDIAATQQYGEFFTLMQTFEEKGYVDSTDGSVYELSPFREEWAQIGWFRWWTYDFVGSDMVFNAHFKWSTASTTPDTSGCGVLFGLQENDDYYVVFLDKSRILFLMKRGEKLYEVGKTRGTGRTNFNNPAEADFALAVKGSNAYVSVNGDVTEYTLSKDQTTQGTFAVTILSGTNSDYGTRCEMTDMMLWYPGNEPLSTSPLNEPSSSENLVFRDDFEGSFNSEWTWIRAEDDQWNLTENPGFLHVDLTRTSDPFEGGPDTLFLRWIEEENFEITTRILFEPKRNFQRTGLVVYEDRDNFVGLLRAYADVGNNPGNAIFFDNVSPSVPGYDDADFENFATQISNPSDVYLKLRREGTTYTGYYSLDGQNWTLAGVHTSPIEPVSYGLLIGKSDQPISAEFDFFELYNVP